MSCSSWQRSAEDLALRFSTATLVSRHAAGGTAGGQRTLEQHVDIPVPGGGGPSFGLQGFSSGQRSTASPSRKRISERIVEQIVDPVSRGSLPGSLPSSSSSHSPAGDEERTDERGKGFFRTFPQIKKSAKVAPHSGSELPPHSSSWTAAAQLEGGSRMTTLASRTTGTDALERLPGNHRLASRWCGTAKGMRRDWSGTGTGKRVSPRLTSLLFLLGEVPYRQPRAVCKYWAGGLPSYDHAATCSSSSSSFMAGMVQKDSCSGMYKAGIAGYCAPRAVHFHRKF